MVVILPQESIYGWMRGIREGRVKEGDSMRRDEK